MKEKNTKVLRKNGGTSVKRTDPPPPPFPPLGFDMKIDYNKGTAEINFKGEKESITQKYQLLPTESIEREKVKITTKKKKQKKP